MNQLINQWNIRIQIEKKYNRYMHNIYFATKKKHLSTRESRPLITTDFIDFSTTHPTSCAALHYCIILHSNDVLMPRLSPAAMVSR